MRKLSIAEMERLRAGIEAVVKVNERVLKDPRWIVGAFEGSGVELTTRTAEPCKTVASVLVDGCGDIEDLCAWRAAELRQKGEKAHVTVVQGPQYLTCAVVREDGTQEGATELRALLRGTS